MKINLKIFSLEEFDKNLIILFKHFDKLIFETGTYGLLLFEQKVYEYLKEKEFELDKHILYNKEHQSIDFIKYSFLNDSKELIINCNRNLDIHQNNIDEETGFPIDSFILTLKKGENYEQN